MKKKMLATILTVAMTASLFAGCGGSKDTGSSNDAANNDAAQTAEADADKRDVGGLKLPISTSGEELTIWLVYSGTMVSDLNEIESVKKMEENTGVHVTWIPVEQNEIKDKYGILLSSGDYPDIIYSNMEYPGGFAKGIEDGVIHEDMDTLIRENMPNYMALINSSDEARREATSDEGKMLVVKTIVGRDKTAESEGTYQGLGYRADLLEKLGMDVPTTVDGWHDVLVKAKESGIQNPFVLDTNGGSPLAQSWGVSTEGVNYWMMLKGDKVTNGAVEDGFAGYLETMRQWYSEGLINPNFTSFNYYLDTPNSINGNDGILYSRILSAFTGKNYSNFHMVTEQPDEYIQAIAAPALKEGDKVVQCANRIIAKEGMYITSSCKNPELAAKWLDYQYTEEGTYLNWYGIEGVTYTIGDDGLPVFMDSVFNNDSGLSTNDYLSKYALNWGNSWLGKHDVAASEQVSTTQAGGHNQEQESVAIWSEPETNIFLTNAITLTDEEGDAVNSKLTAIQTMTEEYTVNYIIGEDNRTFEEFRAQLYEFGMQEVLDIYQAAYDRYLAR